jgi:serine/threonine-protein kinase
MHYISPEQISGEEADARSDLYAVGITLYEMITGRLPIEGASYAQIIANHLQHDPAPPSQVNPRVPETLSAAVMKALAKDKGQRWQSAAEFREALEAAHLGDASRLTMAKPADARPTAIAGSGGVGAAGGSAANAASNAASDATGFNANQGAGFNAKPQTGSGVHSPEVLHEIAVRLASHVGPIANILVKRASSSAHDLRDLCEQVAKEIESPEARKKFLSSVQGHIRASGSR